MLRARPGRQAQATAFALSIDMSVLVNKATGQASTRCAAASGGGHGAQPVHHSKWQSLAALNFSPGRNAPAWPARLVLAPGSAYNGGHGISTNWSMGAAGQRVRGGNYPDHR